MKNQERHNNIEYCTICGTGHVLGGYPQCTVCSSKLVIVDREMVSILRRVREAGLTTLFSCIGEDKPDDHSMYIVLECSMENKVLGLMLLGMGMQQEIKFDKSITSLNDIYSVLEIEKMHYYSKYDNLCHRPNYRIREDAISTDKEAEYLKLCKFGLDQKLSIYIDRAKYESFEDKKCLYRPGDLFFITMSKLLDRYQTGRMYYERHMMERHGRKGVIE